MPEINTSFTQHQPAFVTQSSERWAITYPVQPNEDPVTGHTSSLPDFLAQHTATTFLSLKEHGFLLIPDAVFDDQLQADYGRFIGQHPGDVLRYISWPQADCVYLYSAPEPAPHSGPLHTYPHAWTLQSALQAMYDDTGNDNFAILDGDEVSLFFYRQNKLVFYNRFPYQNYDELSYFIIQSIRQSGASTDKPVKLLAEGYSAGRATENVNRFVRTELISTGRLPELNDMDLPDEMNLFGLQQCALSVAG